MAVESRTGKLAKTASVSTGPLETVKSWPQRAKNFYQDVRTELKKVSSPSRKEVQATTAVVIVTVAIFGVYFWLVDMAIGHGVSAVLHHFTNK